ncbi:protein FAM178B isoform X1 [Pongo pygmaeus]|nr:protein FAM178B isoform X1 [Pongo pygmaeus]
MSHGLQMAGPQETVLALPLREGVQAAATVPVLLSNLEDGLSDHPLDQGPHCPARRPCSPASAPAPTSPKKPKMQEPGETFPTDWSPPPVEFLNPRVLQASREAPAQRWVGVAGPQGLRRLASELPEELEQEHLDLDPKRDLALPEKLFWNTAGPSQQAAAPEFSWGGSGSYFNNLDYLLQEKREQALEQERERLLLQECLNLNSLDLDEDEVLLTPEHRMLVEKYSVSLQTIPPVHPGETVFLPRRHPLPCILDSSLLKPRSHLEGLFLSSPPAQQLSFLRSGLLNTLYLHMPDCPVPLLQWLFQLVTWPPETSLGAFGLLWDLIVDGIFLQPDEDKHLWCPSLQEVREAFHSLGAHSPALYPLGPLWHGGRVLPGEAGLSENEEQDAPQEVALDISLGHIYKFLALCAQAQPGAYTDENLMGLIELLCRTGLDVGLRLLPKVDLQQLLLLLLENIREWPGKLQELCCTLSWVSDHHHNLLALVQFFPDMTSRSRRLRSQLSLVVIARMLGQQETLPLWQEKTQQFAGHCWAGVPDGQVAGLCISRKLQQRPHGAGAEAHVGELNLKDRTYSIEVTQLSSLSRLLGLMRPSSLRQYLGSVPLPPCQEQQPKASAELDHKACYLCHSLLMLAGVVVSCQDITPDQWGELQLLCMQLDRHINTQIRESPQAMHHTMLKDLATQTYIRWQELLTHCQPQAQYFSPWKDI